MQLTDKPAYTVAEVSTLTGLSRWAVVRLFENEPGTLALTRPAQMNKRRYRSLRIPRAVYQRVIGRMTHK